MRSKITLVLLFLNVALFFFIFRFERAWRIESESFETRSRVLGPEAADIRTLEVTSQTPGASFSLERRGDGWFLTRPVVWPANPIAVSKILNELQLLEHVTSFSTADLAKNGQSLADYGLDQPKLTLSFTSGPGGTGSAPANATVLRIGDTTRVGDQLYVLSPDGKRIHVVSRTLAETLSVPIDQLRSEMVFDIPVFEAQSLSIQTATPSGDRSPSVRLRRDSGRWRFETPILAFANKADTENTINALDSLRAKAFPASVPGVPPEAAPAVRVTLEGNNRDETLFIGAPTGTPGDYYAQLKDRPAVFTVSIPDRAPPDHGLMQTLTNAADELRDRHVLDFDPHTVTAITLTAPNLPEIDLQRLEGPADGDENARWQIVRRGGGGPETLPADRGAVQHLLEQLQLLSAVRFQSDAPTTSDLADWGLDGPARDVSLTIAGTPPSQITLQIGRPARRDSNVYARIAGTPPVYAVDGDILLETPVSPLAWRDRLISHLPASARITGLALTTASGDRTIYSQRLSDGETWETALAGETPPRREAVRAVLEQLQNLRAGKFTQDGFTDKLFVAEEMRTWSFKLDATISLPAGADAGRTETETLWFTERLGGAQQWAGSKEFGAVFEIEQPFVDALWTLTYGTRDPGPPPGAAPSAAGGGTK